MVDLPTLGWGKHSVRLYAGRTRRGKAPASPCSLKRRGIRKRRNAEKKPEKLSPLVGWHQKQRRIEEVPCKIVIPPCEPLCAVLSGREGKHTLPAQKCSVEAVFRAFKVSGIVSARENTKDESHSRIKAGGRKHPCGKYFCPQCGRLLGRRCAGSYGGFYGAPKWGQKRRGDIASAVIISESLLLQEEGGGHAPKTTPFKEKGHLPPCQAPERKMLFCRERYSRIAPPKQR